MGTQPAPILSLGTRASALAELFLGRLRRLVALQPVPEVGLDLERLRRKAIYSTYMDCRDLGLEAEAHAALGARGGG